MIFWLWAAISHYAENFMKLKIENTILLIVDFFDRSPGFSHKCSSFCGLACWLNEEKHEVLAGGFVLETWSENVSCIDFKPTKTSRFNFQTFDVLTFWFSNLRRISRKWCNITVQDILWYRFGLCVEWRWFLAVYSTCLLNLQQTERKTK